MASQVQIRPEPVEHHLCRPNVMPDSEIRKRLDPFEKFRRQRDYCREWSRDRSIEGHLVNFPQPHGRIRDISGGQSAQPLEPFPWKDRLK